MDVEEATDAAVERWKFLLNKMFQPHPIPTQDEEEEEEEMMMTTEQFFLGVQTKEGCLCYCAFVY